MVPALPQQLEARGQGVQALHTRRAPTGADRVPQVDEPLSGDRVGHWDLRRIEVRKRLADAPGPGHHAGDAEADIVGALVADDLKRQAGHRPAHQERLQIGILERPGQGRQKAAGRGTESHAGDVDLHALTLDVGHGVPHPWRLNRIVEGFRDGHPGDSQGGPVLGQP